MSGVKRKSRRARPAATRVAFLLTVTMLPGRSARVATVRELVRNALAGDEGVKAVTMSPVAER